MKPALLVAGAIANLCLFVAVPWYAVVYLILWALCMAWLLYMMFRGASAKPLD